MSAEEELMHANRQKRAEYAGMSYADRQAETARRLEAAVCKQKVERTSADPIVFNGWQEVQS